MLTGFAPGVKKSYIVEAGSLNFAKLRSQQRLLFFFYLMVHCQKELHVLLSRQIFFSPFLLMSKMMFYFYCFSRLEILGGYIHQSLLVTLGLNVFTNSICNYAHVISLTTFHFQRIIQVSKMIPQ